MAWTAAQTARVFAATVNRMVIVPWAVTDINVWVARDQELIGQWPSRTGRVCPACGKASLIGHGQRRRSVHAGHSRSGRGRRCGVVWFWVQRVRCTGCGQTHTLLPAFLAAYQRHPSRARGQACVAREAGASWVAVLAAVGLPMLSTASVRRWVAAAMGRVPAMAAAVALWRAAGTAGMMSAYGPVAQPGSMLALTRSVLDLLAREVAGWPEQEVLAGCNWQASVRRTWLSV